MILFCSLVNPRLDLDMMPQWLSYYSACDFDRYLVFLHEDGRNGPQVREAQRLMQLQGWDTETVDGEFGNGVLQGALLRRVRSAMSARDRMVCADGDELHDIEPRLYRSLAEGCDSIEGQLVDRWDDCRDGATPSLHDADPDAPIDAQYPSQGDLYETVRKHVGASGCHWQLRLPTSKILCSRANLPLVCEGSHGFDFGAGGDGGMRRLTNCNVWHYSWRGSALQRLMTKTYHQPWMINAIASYFHVERDHPDLQEHVRRVKERQAAMGWEPSWA